MNTSNIIEPITSYNPKKDIDIIKTFSISSDCDSSKVIVLEWEPIKN